MSTSLPTSSKAVDTAGKAVGFLDNRLHSAGFFKKQMKKVFPDHWSFMLGEVALYSFIVLLLTGTYLTLFFKPSMAEVTYMGSWVPLQGIQMSEAYETTLNISFDIRGGLLLRQMHHWAALLFAASIAVHMFRVFFTGAFRKPRELNWAIGVILMILASVEGFLGYALPDDLLSGTGIRITQAIIQGMPLVGTYISFFVFGGEFPGNEFIARFYSLHILLVPGIILALITAHLLMVWYQKHTQYPGPGRTNNNVVGYPFFPVYTAKAGGFFFIVFGFLTLLGGLVTINPVWFYGPYLADQVTAGSQPDWYMLWLDGAVRLMFGWETDIAGYTIPWNLIIPAMGFVGAMITPLLLWPWIEAWLTGDKREHHILDRPRNVPTRTALGVAWIVAYAVTWLAGGNDIMATAFHWSINSITWTLRIGLFVFPVIAFILTKRIALGLQRRDREKLLHGYESGRILRHPDGRFTEIHKPLPAKELAKIVAKEDIQPAAMPQLADEHGVRNPKTRMDRFRARFSKWYYGDNIDKPTLEEIEAAHAHAAQEEAAALGSGEQTQLPS